MAALPGMLLLPLFEGGGWPEHALAFLHHDDHHDPHLDDHQ